MLFSIVSTLALATCAFAQSAIQFTSFPKSVTVGQPVTLNFTGGDGSPVKIVLRRGPTYDLKDVQTLTNSATGTSYTWTPSSTIVNGNDYALEIIQGATMNYGTVFSVMGGSSSSSVPVPLSTGVPTMNSTYPTGNTTSTYCPYCTGMPTLTGTAASASGTGGPYGANTTFSSATLTAPTSTAVVAGTAGAGSNNGASATGSAPASSTSSKNGAGQVGSSLALIGGAVAAFVFLN